MAQKIIYFTAGVTATEGELTEIAALNTAAAAKYEVIVKRGDTQVSQSYGAGIDTPDFVAGTVPDAYSAITVFDVDAEPIVVGEEDVVPVSNSAASNSVDGTASITGGNLTIVLDATDQIVSSGDTVVVKNSAGSVSKNGTATVASGVISGVALAATEAIVTDAGDVTVNNSADSVTKTGTATVASGVVSKVNLPATEAIISNGQVIVGVGSGTGTTATIVVENGVIIAIVLS